MCHQSFGWKIFAQALTQFDAFNGPLNKTVPLNASRSRLQLSAGCCLLRCPSASDSRCDPARVWPWLECPSQPPHGVVSDPVIENKTTWEAFFSFRGPLKASNCAWACANIFIPKGRLLNDWWLATLLWGKYFFTRYEAREYQEHGQEIPSDR